MGTLGPHWPLLGPLTPAAFLGLFCALTSVESTCTRPALPPTSHGLRDTVPVPTHSRECPPPNLSFSNLHLSLRILVLAARSRAAPAAGAAEPRDGESQSPGRTRSLWHAPHPSQSRTQEHPHLDPWASHETSQPTKSHQHTSTILHTLELIGRPRSDRLAGGGQSGLWSTATHLPTALQSPTARGGP